MTSLNVARLTQRSTLYTIVLIIKNRGSLMASADNIFKVFLLEETVQLIFYRVNLLQAHLEQLTYDVCIVVHATV